MLTVVILSDIMLSNVMQIVIILNDVILSVVMLFLIILIIIILIVVILSVIMLRDVILIVGMLIVIILGDVMLILFMQSDVMLLVIMLRKIPRHFGANSARANSTLEIAPPFLNPVSQSGSTHTLYYLRMFQNVNKLLRNLISLRQQVLLLYYADCHNAECHGSVKMLLFLIPARQSRRSSHWQPCR
jgi:hypothetical protein